MLRARSCPRHARQHGRGGGRHRRAVDRRAGHPAHHAHVPHRRRRADLRAVVHRVELRRHDQVPRQGQERRRQEHRRRLDCHGPQHRGRGARCRRHRARRASHPVRRAHARRGRREDQARSAHRRMGSVHPADPHRGRRHGRVRGPGRRPVDVGSGRRVDRHRQARGHRLAHVDPRGRPASGDGDQGQGRQGREAQPWRRRPLHARGRRHHLGRSRHQGEAGRRHRPYPDRKRQDARHHRRSAAGGGAVRSAPAEGGRGHRRNLRHGAVRPRLQEQAADRDRAEREGRRAGGVSRSRRASTSICRMATSSRRATTSSTAIRRRTTSWRSRASRSSLPTWSTKSRRSTGCRAWRSTTSTSR